MNANLHSQEFCEVRVCRCGSIYLTIGPTTMKLSPEAFDSVVAKLNGARTPSAAPFYAAPGAKTVN